MVAIEILVEEILRLQNLTMYLQAQLQEAKMSRDTEAAKRELAYFEFGCRENAQALISRTHAAPLVIQYEEGDEIIHTDALPYCWDMTCPCHGCTTWAQVEDMIDNLGKPFDAGLLTSQEQDRLWQGRQV